MSGRRSHPGECELCRRDGPRTFHHLIPRSLHSNKWFRKNYSKEEMQTGLYLCSDCHSALHKFVDEKTLGRHYNTRAKLLSHPEVGTFVKWVSTRSTGKLRTRPPS